MRIHMLFNRTRQLIILGTTLIIKMNSNDFNILLMIVNELKVLPSFNINLLSLTNSTISKFYEEVEVVKEHSEYFILRDGYTFQGLYKYTTDWEEIIYLRKGQSYRDNDLPSE